MRVGSFKNIFNNQPLEGLKISASLMQINAQNEGAVWFYIGQSMNTDLSTVGNIYTGDIIKIKNSRYVIINRSFQGQVIPSSSSSSSSSNEIIIKKEVEILITGVESKINGEYKYLKLNNRSVYVSNNNIYPETNGEYYLVSEDDYNEQSGFLYCTWIHSSGNYKIAVDEELLTGWYLTDNSDGATTVYAKGNIVMDDQGKVLMPGSSEYDNWYSDPSRQNNTYYIHDYVWITDGIKTFPKKQVVGAGSPEVNGVYTFHHKEGDTSLYLIEKISYGYNYGDKLAGTPEYMDPSQYNCPKQLSWTDNNNWSLNPNVSYYHYYDITNGQKHYDIPAAVEGTAPFPSIIDV